MSQVESNQELYGQPATYWKSYSFCSPLDNVMYAQCVNDKLVKYLQKNTDYNQMSRSDQKELVMSSVRAIRKTLNAYPKGFLLKEAA